MALSQTQELIRRRFHECQAIVAAITAKAAPFRAEYEAISVEINALEAKRAEVAKRMHAAAAGLSDAMNEAAASARALRQPGADVAKTGAAPDDLGA